MGGAARGGLGGFGGAGAEAGADFFGGVGAAAAFRSGDYYAGGGDSDEPGQAYHFPPSHPPKLSVWRRGSISTQRWT